MPRYARNGEVSLAYEIVGEGERDILVTFGWVGSFQSAWEHPPHARWLERLATLGRVIMWDKRGTGLSDRMAPDRLPTLRSAWTTSAPCSTPPGASGRSRSASPRARR